MITLLQASPLLLLFAVAAIGFPLGRLRVGQSRLGIAAVLFVGLAFGAVDPALKLPEIVYQLGLVLFVYTVGLGSGPAFFDALRRRGLRDNVFVVSMLLVGAALAVGLHRLLGLGAAQTAGLFTGALTNTPALAGVLEFLSHLPPVTLDAGVLDDPVVGYSIAYPIGDLDLEQRFGAVVTRVRRGDLDFLASDDILLQPGDRVRFVAPRERVADVSAFFGDSYRHLSEIDILTFSLGLVMGLLLGMLPMPIPGGGTFHLGIAGGPLLVALLLSKVDRSGPLLWNLPYSANLTLRQFGLVLFLAGIGTRAGGAFLSTLLSRGGLLLLASGAVITCTTALLTLWVGHRLLKMPMSLLIGTLGGLQTSPAVLSYATEQTGNDIPHIGYATVYPVAMITKIVLAQLLVALLR